MLNRDLKTLLKVPDEVKSILLAITGVGTAKASKLLSEVKDNARGQFKVYCEELLGHISSTSRNSKSAGFGLMGNIDEEDKEDDVNMTSSITGSFRALIDKVKGKTDDTPDSQAPESIKSQSRTASTRDSIELFLDEPEAIKLETHNKTSTSGSFSKPPTGVFEAIPHGDAVHSRFPSSHATSHAAPTPEETDEPKVIPAQLKASDSKRKPDVSQSAPGIEGTPAYTSEPRTPPEEKNLTQPKPTAQKRRPPSGHMKGTGIFKKVRAKRTGGHAKSRNTRSVVTNTSSSEFIKEPPVSSGDDS
jgi:hypothetical protein